MQGHSQALQGDIQALAELTLKISDAEDAGVAAPFDKILAPRLAFQRADPQQTVDDRGEFLQKVKPSGPRQTRIIDPIQVYGNRAIVQCIVTIDGQDYHNLRLYVRREKEWKLLGWANERWPIEEPVAAPNPATE